MKLCLSGLQDPGFRRADCHVPEFDIPALRARTSTAPAWLHLGAGNIFRAFPAMLCQRLIEMGEIDRGVIAAECFDEEILDAAYAPCDNLALDVSLKADGTMEKAVVASVTEALAYSRSLNRLEEIARADSLQMISLTITEKGYAGGENSIIGKLAGLLRARYAAGARPLALLSLDNCSHNGDLLRRALLGEAEKLGDAGFLDYLRRDVTYPLTMIDKITPRPAPAVLDMLEKEGFQGLRIAVTAKHSYVSAMVNAEECQYLAIQDDFPCGRPPFEKVGVIMTDRATVEKIERMKVSTCLNPLHTCLAIFGCLLGYTKISDEARDPDLAGLIRKIGYGEGLPVAADPGVLRPRDFLDEVLTRRFPNPFVPDTPQRIACDTSKKLSVRFGETLRAYMARGERDLSRLAGIASVFAGYARYLTGIDDMGAAFERSPDPNLERLSGLVAGYELGKAFDPAGLRALFSDEALFGVNLYDVNLGSTAEALFARMNRGPGAIRAALKAILEGGASA